MDKLKYYLKKFIEVLFIFGPFELIKRVIRKFRSSKLVPDQNRLYSKWMKEFELPYLTAEKKLLSQTISKWDNKPKISILMPVYNIEPELLDEAIRSIKEQWYENWELCLNDDKSTNQATLDYLDNLKNSKEYSEGKIKIRFSEVNENISAATNHSFEISTGDYVILMDNDDFLRENALYEIVKVINNLGNFDLIYYDEDKLDMSNNRIEPFFKPDFSPELMWSMMYPTHAAYSRRIYDELGGLRKGYEGSQDYDLVLRVMEKTDKIYHIPQILYSWRKIPGSTAENISGKSYAIDAAKRSLQDALERREIPGLIENDFYPFRTHIDVTPNKTVDIIIPIKDKVELLKQLIDSIVEKNTYPAEKINIIVIDHESSEEKTLDYLENLKYREDYKFKVLRYSGEYNFSALNNYGVNNSNGDFILFLNNDIEVISVGFIEEFLAWASQKEIGAVGAKLLYPTWQVQHAGIILGYGGVANHVYYKMPHTENFYFSQLHCVRNYLAVTAAAMMVERRKFEEVGGFEEKLPRAFNDVDLCLKLHSNGFRNVYTPYVVMLHFESQSRDPRVDLNEDMFMVDKWKKYIEIDPYYNPNLSKDSISGPPFSINA